jgi:hypothetical protein
LLPFEDHTMWRWDVGWWKELAIGWWQQRKTSGGAAFFASSAATIFASLAFISSIKANALLMPVFVSTGVCAMATSVGGAHRDGDGGSSHGVLGSAVICEDCATIGLGGTAHGDGNDEPNSDADRSTTEPMIETRAL